VDSALERMRLLTSQGLHLAGYMAYEAGLALEPRLTRRLTPFPDGSPLLWFGAFAGFETVAAGNVPELLSSMAGPGKARIGPLEPELGAGDYSRRFTRIQEAIARGDIYQANLTFPLSGPYRGDPMSIYAALRRPALAGHGAVVHDGEQWLLSFSPELFFTLQEGLVRTRPMKGTRPRAADAEADAQLRADLSRSQKDRAENLMIVDLLRNDLSRVALPGSVEVSDLFTVESYPTVHQMTSGISASLAGGRDAIDVIRALFPCGSITGAPKIRAMELIDEVERGARGPYCGSIGSIDPTGDAAFNVAIRTLRLVPEEHGSGRAHLGVGSAVVADSEALAEWRECLIKGGFVRKPEGETAEAAFDLIETMRFTPEDGIPLLELHLERAKRSAAAFGFTFDRHALRNAIQALCFEAQEPARLRLVAAPSGAYALELGTPPPPLPTPASVAVLRLPVDSGDWRLRHKTSDRGFYALGLDAARGAGAHEAIFLRDDGLVTEGSFTNLFVERDGMLLTPPASLGLLEGVLRRSLLEAGRAREAELNLDDLAGGFLIGNAVRGLMPAMLLV